MEPNEIVKRKSSMPLKIYAGNSIFIEIKECKKKLCILFSKENDGAVRNGFNREMDHFEKVEEALGIIKDPLRSSK